MKIVYTKPVLDIFSKQKIKKEKEGEKQKIIIDYREKGSLVASELIKFGFEIEFRELKVADYLVNNVAIERKTVSDFISSMLNKRIIRQLEELQQYEQKLLIIEGIENQEIYSDDNLEGLHPNAIRGFLLSIAIKQKIPMIFTKDSEDTARFISVLAKKKEKESSLNVSKKTLNTKERLQFILEGFPGIGPKTAKKLLENFKTLKNIANAPLEELEKVIGVKADIFKLIREEY
ncbi:3'-flap repair endonuclease Xpf [uncultured archaeon]|nr:3'-flap repair endonuclease Xpf [uncultured archaeon]